jgi:hypothetical protein
MALVRAQSNTSVALAPSELTPLRGTRQSPGPMAMTRAKTRNAVETN